MAAAEDGKGDRIAGAVDALVDGVLHGWAEDRQADEAPRLAAWIGERQVGAARADGARADLDRATAFSMPLDPVPGPGDLAAFRVEAAAADGSRAVLPVNPSVAADIVEPALAELAAAVPWRTLLRVVTAELVWRDLGDPFLSLAEGVAGRQVSPFLLPVGLPTPDGVAVVGHGGQLFVTGGSNDLAGQYRDARSAEAIAAAAQPWAELFDRRAEALAERGIAYRQMIVPEKSTALPEYFPVLIDTPTPLFAAVERAVASSASVANYVPLLGPMLATADRSAFFRGVDSHMSARGFFFLLARLLESIGEPVPEVRFDVELATPGDLGAHFPGVPLCSVDRMPRLGELGGYGRQIERVERVRGVRHVGARTVTRNPGAPIDRKVMVFGNSHFGFGGSFHSLSGWMERWFREYHFHWSAEFDFDAIDSVRPDIVVGQTIERFLNRVPER